MLMLCYAMLCYAMLCYAVLCCAVLCYAVLCCAMLCYAVLCCAMLCFAVAILSNCNLFFYVSKLFLVDAKMLDMVYTPVLINAFMLTTCYRNSQYCDVVC